MPTPPREARTLQAGQDPSRLAHILPQVLDTPLAEVAYAVGLEGATGANTRRFTIQVKDRLRKDWKARWLLWAYVSATETGDPDATGNTCSWSTGSVREVVVADAEYRVLTNASGVAVLDLTVAGAATRYLNVLVVGRAWGVSADWA